MQKSVVIGVGTFGACVVNAICKRNVQSVSLMAISNNLRDFENIHSEVNTVFVQSPEFMAGHLEGLDFLSISKSSVIVIVGSMSGSFGNHFIPLVCKFFDDQHSSFVLMLGLPFQFEGKKRMERSFRGVEELGNLHYPLIVASNDGVQGDNGNTSAFKAFQKCDEAFATSVLQLFQIDDVKTKYASFKEFRNVMKEYLPDLRLHW